MKNNDDFTFESTETEMKEISNRRDLLVMRRFAVMATATRASRNVSADLDIEYGSILPGRTVTSPAMIRYVQYPTDHTHLRTKKTKTKHFPLDLNEKTWRFYNQ